MQIVLCFNTIFGKSFSANWPNSKLVIILANLPSHFVGYLERTPIGYPRHYAHPNLSSRRWWFTRNITGKNQYWAVTFEIIFNHNILWTLTSNQCSRSIRFYGLKLKKIWGFFLSNGNCVRGFIKIRDVRCRSSANFVKFWCGKRTTIFEMSLNATECNSG